MQVWVHRTVATPAVEAWALLTDLDRWSEWGPSVSGATLDTPGRFEVGATGRVLTVLGPSLPFRVTELVPGQRWGWSVAGVRATSHSVEDLGGGRSRVGFGVPVWAPFYVPVCMVALRRIEALLTPA